MGVAQSLISATDTLGHHPRQWICICTMPKDVGIAGVGNLPHMCVRGDNTTPISNDGVAQL